MAFRNPIVGGDTLVRNAIQSEGFQTGVQGWRIERGGDAEFNDVDVRGTVEVGPDGGLQVIIRIEDNRGQIEFPTHAATEDLVAKIYSAIGNAGQADEYTSLVIESGKPSSADDQIFMALSSQYDDGSVAATFDLGIFDTVAETVAPILSADLSEVHVYPDLAIDGDLSVGGVGQVRFIEKSGAQGVTSSTLANATDMVFEAEAGAKYEARLRVTYNSATTDDFKMDWTIPAGCSMSRSILGPSPAGANVDNQNLTMSAIWRANTTAQVGSGTGGVSNAFTAWWEDCIVDNSAGVTGNVQLRFARNAGTGTATMNGGSYMIVTRVE